MTRMRASILVLILALATILSSPGKAAGPDEFSDQDWQDIARIEGYLNDITTLHARFVQISSNGALAKGDLYLDRPGRMRFEYDPPHPVVMIANGLSFLYYDRELEEATFLPLWETPLWFFVRENVDLINDAQVLGIDRHQGTLSLKLAQRDKEDLGYITLVFSGLPLRLMRWQVDDVQGLTTEVSLQDLNQGLDIDEAVFDQSPYRPRDSSEERG